MASENIWALPTNPGKLTGIAFDPTYGNIYFGERNPNNIGEINPTNNTLTEWALPTHSGKLTGVVFDPTSRNIYFGESNPNKIGRLAPATNTFTEWSIANHPLSILVDPCGNVFFADNIGRLGRHS